MKFEQMSFMGQFSLGGFRWDDSASGVPLLVPIGNAWRPYQPPHDLFLTFATLNQEADAVREFACSYGLLGAPSNQPTAKQEGDHGAGERLSYWCEQIRQMREVITLWMAITDRDEERLGKIIHWPAKNHVEYVGEERKNAAGKSFRSTATIATPDFHAERLTSFQSYDRLGPARLVLQDMLNATLAKFITYEMAWVPGFKSINANPRPTSLIGCIWLQLITVIDNSWLFRNCAGCDKLILIAPEGAAGYRTHRRSCSGKCRVRVHDRRQRQARALRQEGMPLKVIAARLSTDVEKVKNWINA